MKLLLAWWHSRRLERAQLALADAEHELRQWGDHMGTPPSERARMEDKVERAKRKLARAHG